MTTNFKVKTRGEENQNSPKENIKDIKNIKVDSKDFVFVEDTELKEWIMYNLMTAKDRKNIKLIVNLNQRWRDNWISKEQIDSLVYAIEISRYYNYIPKIVMKKGYIVVYLGESEKYSDFLDLYGTSLLDYYNNLINKIKDFANSFEVEYDNYHHGQLTTRHTRRECVEEMNFFANKLSFYADEWFLQGMIPFEFRREKRLYITTYEEYILRTILVIRDKIKYILRNLRANRDNTNRFKAHVLQKHIDSLYEIRDFIDKVYDDLESLDFPKNLDRNLEQINKNRKQKREKWNMKKE